MSTSPPIDSESLPSLQSILPPELWSESFASRREASPAAPRWSLLAHHRASRKVLRRRQRTACASEHILQNKIKCETHGRCEANEQVMSPTLSTTLASWSTPLRNSFDAASRSANHEEHSGGNGNSKDGKAVGVENALFIDPNALTARAVLASVLRKVRALHFSRCPLCAPSRPPRWWTSIPLIYRANAEAEKTLNEKCVEDIPPKEEDEEDVVAKAQAFLSHVRKRRDGLEASRPIMYVTGEHAMQRACVMLGGVALLEALLIGAEGM